MKGVLAPMLSHSVMSDSVVAGTTAVCVSFEVEVVDSSHQSVFNRSRINSKLCAQVHFDCQSGNNTELTDDRAGNVAVATLPR
jgi:hypothetical protein